MGMDHNRCNDDDVFRRDFLDLQEKEYVLRYLTKPFDNPKFIHIFARFLAEACFFYRKSLRQGTINNV